MAFQVEDDELENASRDAYNKKLMLNAAGGVTDALTNVRSAAEIALGQGRPQNRFGDSFRAAAENIENPMDQKAKAMAYMKAKRENALDADNDSMESVSTKSKRYLAKKMDPTGNYDQMSGSQIDKILPTVKEKYEMDQKALDRQESREERRYLAGINRQDRLDARADKQKELSATQAKQRGLYEVGKKAESQFNKAVSDKNDYDPTAVGQIIDNSEWAPNWMKNDKAIESQAAQSAWVEGFLRDASGAAIPPSERLSYAKDFFPQPGDTPDVVANKAALRQQKMDNARVAAGIETGHGPGDRIAKPSPVRQERNKKTGEMRITYSDGSTEIIPRTAGR